MKLNKDFTYCNGNSSSKCKQCKRKLDLKYKDVVLWRIKPDEKNCKEFIRNN